MPNAAIYARYSSQAQRSESIEQQIDACRKWCAANSYDITRIYHDDARSGRSVVGRDEFLRMVDDAKLGGFSVVVVYKLDRFARDRYDAAVYRRKLRDCGVEVKSAMENIPDGPEGRLMESLMEGVAEWYSADLSQKTLRGMRSNAEKCMANGVPVFGYDVGEDGKYVINDAQANIVRQTYRWWIQGVDSVEIGKRVCAAGFVTAMGRKPGRQWARSIIHDERYIGVYHWDDVRIEGGMPQIVDAETWRVANSRRRATHAPKRTHDYPLVGRIYDRETGLPMTGYSAVSRGREYTYYSANVGSRHLLAPQDAVEDAVTRAVSQIMKTATAIDAVIEYVEQIRSHADDLPEVAGARETLARSKRAMRNLRAAIAQLDEESPTTRDMLISDLIEHERNARFAQSVIERAADGMPTADEIRDLMAHIMEECTPTELMEHCVGCVVVDRAERAVIVSLPILGNKKALNPTSEFSAVSVWLPSEVLGSNDFAFVPYERGILLFHRVA